MGLFGIKKKSDEVISAQGVSFTKAENTRIKVLGSGCAKCRALEKNVLEALAEIGSSEKVGHVRDYAEIALYGVMSTPALVIDGKVVSYGKVLAKDQAAQILKNAGITA